MKVTGVSLIGYLHFAIAGKDQIIFLTKNDYETPGDNPPVLLDDDEDDEPGMYEVNTNKSMSEYSMFSNNSVDFPECTYLFIYRYHFIFRVWGLLNTIRSFRQKMLNGI